MPTPQKLFCPHCQAILRFELEQAGAVQQCRWCERSFRVPHVAPEANAGGDDQQVPKAKRAPTPLIPADKEDWLEQTVAEANRSTVTDQGLEEPFSSAVQLNPAHTPTVSADYPQLWEHIPSGMTICQIGLAVCLLVFLFGICSGDVGRILNPSVSPFSPESGRFTEPNLFDSPYARSDLSGYLCGIVIGIAFQLLGQVICCSVPEPTMRNKIIQSTFLLFLYLGLVVLQLLSNESLSRHDAPGVLVCSAIIVGLSHILFMVFLFDLVRHFRDDKGRKFFRYYFLSGTMLVVCTLFLGCLIRPVMPDFRNSPMGLFLAVLFAWSIAQWIAFIYLVHRTGGQIKKQMRRIYNR